MAPTSSSPSNSSVLTARQRGILDVIETAMRERGYPPSVREIGEAVGLTSPSTVHSHLASLERMGFLRRDPTKPRDRGALRPELGCGDRAPPGTPRPPRRRRPPAPTCSHRRTSRRSIPSPKTSPAPATCSCSACDGALDGRARHHGRRLRRVSLSSRPPTTARSSSPASPVVRPR
ncbi:MAG: helix-turn-helix domain-containing protein [Ilumatobacteraceae bacterium]